MVSRLTRLPAGVLASVLGALTVWLALGMRDQPFWGLLGAAVGIAAVYRPQWTMLSVVPVSLIGIGWPLWRLTALSMIAAIGFAALLSAQGRVKLRPAHAVVPVFAAAVAVSAAWPQLIARPQREFDLITLLAGVLVFTICAGIRISPQAACAVAALSGAATASMILWSVRYGGSLDQWEYGRLGGLGQNSNGLGLLLALPFVAAAGLAWHRKQPLWLMAGLPCGAVIWLSESRGATVAVACGLAYVVVAGRRWWWQAGGLAASVLVALAIAQFCYLAETPPPTAAHATPTLSAPPSPAMAAASPGSDSAATGSHPALPDSHTAAPPLGDTVLPSAVSAVVASRVDLAASRTRKDIDRSNEVRFRAGVLAGQTALLYPVRGIGYASFAEFAEKSPGFGIYMNTHNEYLRLAAEAGMVSLLAFAALLWFGLRPRHSSAFAVPRALVVCYAVFLVFGNPLSNVSLSIVFWLSLGLLVANPPKERLTGEANARAAV